MNHIIAMLASLLCAISCAYDRGESGALIEQSLSPDRPEPPYCEGRELGITQLQAAQEFSTNFCALLPLEQRAGCIADWTDMLCVGPGTTLCTATLCGDQLPVYYQCLEDTLQGVIPVPCWELTGWDL